MTRAGAGARRRRARLLVRVALVVAVVVVVVALVVTVALWWRGRTSIEQTSSSSVSLAFGAIAVEGRVGATPTVSLSRPLHVGATKHTVLERGTGRVIAENTPVLLSVSSFDASTARALNAGGRPWIVSSRAERSALDEGMYEGIVGVPEGSRVVFVRRVDPSTCGDAQCQAEVDVVDVLSSIATGEPEAAGGGPLSVEIRPEGPSITHGEEVPSEVTTQVLLRGEGEQVASDDRVVLQYSVQGWSDDVVRHSTWSSGVPEFLDMSTAMPGLVQALVDQRVGSRIAVTVPPEQGTGDDTLCLVVDLLATVHTSAG